MSRHSVRICPNCHVAPLIHSHPTLNGWFKCELCGYSEKEIKKKHGTKQRKK